MKSPYRVLIIASHPIPYIIPLFRLMAEHPQLKILVAYSSKSGAETYHDREFGTAISWDVPLLEGYPSIYLQNISPKPGLGHFWGLINPELWSLVDNFDVIIVYSGYAYATFWIAALAAKLKGKGFIFSTDASSIEPRDGAPWKSRLKPILLPLIFRLGDAILVSSRFGVEMVENLGIPKARIILTPSATDNDWWLAQGAKVNPVKVRENWGIPTTATVILFCGKFQPWKRPLDLLQAFAQANITNSYLLYVGGGDLQQELETQAKELGVKEQVKFLGFYNQTELPDVYTAADLLCLCSEYEPFGVVVSEAMLCECGVIVSDRVGAREIVNPGDNGFIYPCGDIPALAAILQEILPQKERLKLMGKAAKKRMETWSPRENVAAQIRAIETIKVGCPRPF